MLPTPLRQVHKKWGCKPPFYFCFGGAMNIDLYKNTSEENAIEKIIIDKKTIEGTLKTTIDITNFSVIFNFFDDWNNYNYVYVEKLKRYYFVDSKRIINNSLVEYDLIEDVLMSFKDLIRNQNILLNESEMAFSGSQNNYAAENKLTVANNYEMEDLFNTNKSGVLITVRS